MSNLIDISPSLSPRTAVWPGDTSLSREVLCEITTGATVTLSSLRSTVHLGAHADAPNHYSATGEDIASRSLEKYVGPCQVIEVITSGGSRVTQEQITDAICAPRVLLKTSSYPDSENFNTDFAAYSPELIDWLADKGVILIGIDTPSIDPFESKDLPSHQAALRHDLAILEGLVLAHVAPGVYELIAPPLKLEGFDASPVRAVLKTVRSR